MPKIEVWWSETIAVNAKLDKKGRLVIPVDMRLHLGMRPGDEVLLVAGDSELRVVPSDEAVRRGNELPRPLMASSKYL